jgi:hypothetical protein
MSCKFPAKVLLFHESTIKRKEETINNKKDSVFLSSTPTTAAASFIQYRFYHPARWQNRKSF